VIGAAVHQLDCQLPRSIRIAVQGVTWTTRTLNRLQADVSSASGVVKTIASNRRRESFNASPLDGGIGLRLNIMRSKPSARHLLQRRTLNKNGSSDPSEDVPDRVVADAQPLATTFTR